MAACGFPAKISSLATELLAGFLELIERAREILGSIDGSLRINEHGRPVPHLLRECLNDQQPLREQCYSEMSRSARERKRDAKNRHELHVPIFIAHHEPL